MLPRHTLRLSILKTVTALAAKTVQSFADDYRIALSEIVAANLNGDIDAAEQAARHRSLLRESAAEIYGEGLYDSGKFDSRDDAYTFDADDRAAIAKFEKTQLEHVAQFAKDTTAARLNDADDDATNETRQNSIFARVDTWGRAMQSLGDEGRATGAKNVMATWKYGDTAHCDTCASLNGQRHKLKWFTSRGYYPRKPGNDKLSCGGWNCQCQLVDDDGKAVL